MKQFLLLFIVLLLPVPILAQQRLAPPSKKEMGTAVSCSTFTMHVECSGLRVPSPDEKDWMVNVISVEHQERDKHIQSVKDSLFALKILHNKAFGTDHQLYKAGDSLEQKVSFNGFMDLNFTPTDNTLAVSDGGIIVAATNASFESFNTSGTQITPPLSFKTLVADPSLNGLFFDPKVIYDSQADRFIMMILHSSDPSKSRVVLMFSKTSNPLQGWYIYKLAGDALANKSWSDYPNMAVSNEEIFITANLYDSSADFQQPVIFQIGKSEGFSGALLDMKIWSNIKNAEQQTPFTMVPAGNGQKGNYGPGIYLVSNMPNGGELVYLFRITGERHDAAVQMLAYSIKVPTYNFPGDAPQKGSSDLLDVGLCRIRSAFYLDGIIHLVFSSGNTNGFSQISYIRMDADAKLAQLRNLFYNGLDYAYPAVASWSNLSSYKSVIIAFLSSGPETFPEIRVSSCDEDMNFTNSQLAFEGSSFVNKLPGSPERWGDYIGICPRYSSPFPDVWIAGAYGASQTWNTRIMHYSGDPDTVQINDSVQTTKFYPNPDVQFADFYFTFTESSEITISLYDMQGRLIKELFNDVILKGEKKIFFNKSGLATGYYIALIKSNGKVIATEKIVVIDKF